MEEDKDCRPKFRGEVEMPVLLGNDDPAHSVTILDQEGKAIEWNGEDYVEAGTEGEGQQAQQSRDGKDEEHDSDQYLESDDSTLRKSGNRDSADDFTSDTEAPLELKRTVGLFRFELLGQNFVNIWTVQRHLVDRRNHDRQRHLCLTHGSPGQDGLGGDVSDSLGGLRLCLHVGRPCLRRVGHHDSQFWGRVRLLHGGFRSLPRLHVQLGLHHDHQTQPVGDHLYELCRLLSRSLCL